MLIAAPSDENECRQLLYTAYQFPGPAAVRYPRGTGIGAQIEKNFTSLPIGKGRIVRSINKDMKREGEPIAILCFGSLLANALPAAERFNATLCDMRFVKPLDEELIERMANSHSLIVTLEENAIAGGAGSAVSEYLASLGYTMQVLHLGLNDTFVDHANHKQQLIEQGLDASGIELAIQKRLKAIETIKAKPMVS